MRDEVARWIEVAPVLVALFVAVAVLGLLFFVLAFAIAFGVRLGPRERPYYEQHGVLESLWKGAQYFGGIRTELSSINAKLDRALASSARRTSDADSISFSIRK